MSTPRLGALSATTGLLTALLALGTTCRPATQLDPPRAFGGDARAPALHALLLNGGGRPGINYYSHLDHLRRLLQLLDAAGVTPDRIDVFSGDGEDPEADLAVREGELPEDFWLLPSQIGGLLRPPIEQQSSRIAGFALQPAKRAPLRAWFEGPGSRLAAGDTLLFYVTDHGEKNADDLRDNTISLWGESLYVSELRELLGLLDPDVRVVMLMSQCYSGAFANAIFTRDEHLPGGNVCGYFSTTADRKAHGCYAEASGKETVGHSHRIFEALVEAPSLPDAQREVLVTDGTPDVPHASTSFFLRQELERAAQQAGHEPDGLIDELLDQALSDPLTWEREIRLLDRVGQAFGFASPRSLAQLDAEAEGLSQLRKQFSTYADRWRRTLDDLRQANLGAFREAHPEWQGRLEASALKALDAEGRQSVRRELLDALARFTAQDRERATRLRDLHWKASEAKAGRYRADVRLAAVLRMRTLLTDTAGRHYMARYAAEDVQTAFLRLEGCEQLSLAGKRPLGSGLARGGSSRSEPFPTLVEEQRRLSALLPGWLGVRYRDPEPAERKRALLPSGASVVRDVLPDSPAAAAGLQGLDVLLGPPGAPFTERHAVREWVMQGEIGAPLALRILRDDEELELEVRLSAYPLELPKLPGPPQVGSLAPELQLEYLGDVRAPDPTRSRLYFFWATWCGHCKSALPDLMALARERDVAVVAITDESPETVEAFLRKYDGPFPEIVAMDRRRASFRDYGVSGTPTFVLVDADGIVRHYNSGYDARRGLSIEGW